MESLVRTRSGSFTLEDALTLGQIEAIRDEGALEDRIVAVDEVFSQYPRLDMKPEYDRLVHNGNPFRPDQCGAKPAGPVSGDETASDLPGASGKSGGRPAQARVYDSTGLFIGIYAYRPERRWYQPVKIFAGGQ